VRFSHFGKSSAGIPLLAVFFSRQIREQWLTIIFTQQIRRKRGRLAVVLETGGQRPRFGTVLAEKKRRQGPAHYLVMSRKRERQFLSVPK